MRIDGKRVLVVGLGVSGEAAARTAASLGATVVAVDAASDASVRDRAAELGEVRVLLGDDGAGEVARADLVIASPGIRPDAPAFVAAREAGVPVWSEIELAYRIARAPIIGVTGTNGKTTTTHMTTACLAASGMRTTAAGNVGRALCEAVREEHDVIVAEISSFQLHNIDRFHVPVGAVLNIAEDHLDWHGSFAAYAADKARLFESQTPADVAVHFDDDACRHIASRGRGALIPFDGEKVPPNGAGVDDGWIVVPRGKVVALGDLRVRGGAMIANAVAAAAVAAAFGADLDAIARALAAFEPLPHRSELVATIGGVSFVNDSKATNPHATAAALRNAQDVVLIAGGRNKDLDLSVLGVQAPALRAVVAIGEAAGEILAAFDGTPSSHASGIDDAVEKAMAFARPGDTVLLSPACSSWDMFTDYRARGEAFRAAVKRLAEKGGDVS